MAYVQPLAAYHDPELSGIFSAIGGAFKKAGGFVAKKVVPTALSFVPVVGGPASAAYSQIPGIRQRQPRQLPPPRLALQALPPPPAPRLPWWQRAAQAAAERAREDPRLRERAVAYTARYAPPTLLAAAAARQAREAPRVVQAGAAAGLIVPAIVIGGLLLRRRR